MEETCGLEDLKQLIERIEANEDPTDISRNLEDFLAKMHNTDIVPFSMIGTTEIVYALRKCLVMLYESNDATFELTRKVVVVVLQDCYDFYNATGTIVKGLFSILRSSTNCNPTG